MTDYMIQVLTKVSFDTELFNKELNKARRWLTPEEWKILMKWVEEYHSEKIIDGLVYNA